MHIKKSVPFFLALFLFIEILSAPASAARVYEAAAAVTLNAADARYTNRAEIPPVESGYEGYQGDVLLWPGEESYDWRFSVAQSGDYYLEIDYLIIGDTGGNVPIREALIDGALPFSEAGNIRFSKYYEEYGSSYINSNGDEVRPRQRELRTWRTNRAEDTEARRTLPLAFRLEAGEHILTLGYVDGGIAVGRVRFVVPETIKSYSEVSESYKASDYAKKTITLEAESAKTKSDATIRREVDGDPAATPFVYGKSRLNVIGGYAWRKPNQEIVWELDIESPGLYGIAFRRIQSRGEGLPSYRQIKIDGQIPFKEFESYRFKYDKNWITEELVSAGGSPCLVYLDAGIHTFSMTVNMGEMAPFISECNAINIDLGVILRDIMRVTGAEPDPNFEYRLNEKIPSLIDDLKDVSRRLAALSEGVLSLSEGKPVSYQNLCYIASTIDSLINEPEKIPLRMDDITNGQSMISTVYTELQAMSLTLDEIFIKSPEEPPVDRKSNFWMRLWATVSNFVQSFLKDYDQISNSYIDGDVEITSSIKVWAAYGREWAEQIQRMSDEEFTPRTGIQVDLNVMPSGTASLTGSGGSSALLLSVASGNRQDVVMGCDGGTPVELAIRQAAVDLRQFADYDDVEKRFLKAGMIPFEYQGGMYALPETLNFFLMFYRTDVMGELGISPPKTWTDLYTGVLPTLRQNNYNFYYSAGYSPFLFQKGGKFYTDDGKFSALDSQESYDAFVEFTRLYTIYDLPYSTNFFNHFRIGDIPLGVGTFSDYIMLAAGAPELFGKWGIAPIPGVEMPDGSVNCAASGGSQTIIMMSGTGKEKEGWEFMKWWTSKDVQSEFGLELESSIGIEARWITANLEAFSNIPFTKEEQSVIQTVKKHYTDVPVFPGSYMTGRLVGNAQTAVIIQNLNPRDSLEKAVKDINRELFKKQLQYGQRDPNEQIAK